MLHLHPHRVHCGSWACPSCAKVLGAALRERLEAGEQNLRAAGLRLVMLTLTFDPKRFESPRAAMETAKRTRAVAECMRAWRAARGYRAEYLCKWELCKSGWPHVHVLVVVPVGFRFKNPKGGAGEFDGFWLHGISDVDWRDLGGLSGYGSKLAAYTTKEAGGDGLEALRASGIGASGFHWVQPSRGFWERLGVPAFDSRYVGRYENESMRDDDGAVGPVVVERGRKRFADHAERVESCGWTTALVVEGGMRDERPRCEGGHGSTFAVELRCRRRVLAGLLEDYFGSGLGGAECVVDISERGIPFLWQVRGVRPQDLVTFLDWGPPELTGGVDLAEVWSRLGWLRGQPPADGFRPPQAGPSQMSKLAAG